MIIADDHGDMLVFTSVEDAVDYLEDVDVINGEYLFFNEDGYVLRATVNNHQISFQQTQEIQAEFLASELRKYVAANRRVIIPTDWIQHASLPELIGKAKEFFC